MDKIYEKFENNGKIDYICINCGTNGDEPFEECGICGLRINDCKICLHNNLCLIKQEFISYSKRFSSENINKEAMITALAQNCNRFKKKIALENIDSSEMFEIEIKGDLKEKPIFAAIELKSNKFPLYQNEKALDQIICDFNRYNAISGSEKKVFDALAKLSEDYRWRLYLALYDLIDGFLFNISN